MDAEKQAIQNALSHTKGNKLEAARLIGIGKTSLYDNCNQYSINMINPPYDTIIRGIYHINIYYGSFNVSLDSLLQYLEPIGMDLLIVRIEFQ